MCVEATASFSFFSVQSRREGGHKFLAVRSYVKRLSQTEIDKIDVSKLA